MAKVCKICGRPNFSHLYCKAHVYLYYNSKPKKENKPKPKYLNDELELAKIKKKKSQHIGIRCQFSGAYGGIIQLVHIIRRSDSKELKLDKRNLILGSQEFHTMFDDGKGWYLLQYFPWRMKAILRRMRDLDPLYFNRFCGKNGIDTESI
jgi:hypothetical protein